MLIKNGGNYNQPPTRLTSHTPEFGTWPDLSPHSNINNTILRLNPKQTIHVHPYLAKTWHTYVKDVTTMGDRDIRPATKSDMGCFGSSFSLAYIKMIPFSRGI